jgi:putative membrane protein
VSSNAATLPSSNQLADDRTRLAVQRTVAALDRTLMAWVRTATSLISFGFTIYKFFQALRESQGTRETHLLGPRGVALIMMGLAVFGLVTATWQYQQQMRQLRQEYGRYGRLDRPITPVVAAIISTLGIIGFVLVVLRQ